MPANRTSFNSESGARASRAGRLAKKRQADFQAKVFELREQGKAIKDIALELHTHESTISKIVFSGVHKAERIQKFNEALVSMSPAGIRVVQEHIAKGSLEAAMWLLKETGVVGKEQVNLTINAQNAQINTMSSETLDAARQVAAAMRASIPKQLKQAADDLVGEIVSTQKGDNDDEHTGVDVGIEAKRGEPNPDADAGRDGSTGGSDAATDSTDS